MNKPALKSRGTAFYDRTLEAFELTDSERELLSEAARLMDELETLKAQLDADGLTLVTPSGILKPHPCLAEVRSHRIALARLLAQLALPDETGEALATATQVRGRQNAAKRWTKAV
jgi:hypothetical protein